MIQANRAQRLNQSLGFVVLSFEAPPLPKSSLQQALVVRPVGEHQCRVEAEYGGHDDDVAWHHENAPHEHAQGVGEGHQHPELFTARKEDEDARNEFGSADERKQKLGVEHRQDKGGRLRLGIPRGHDGGVRDVDVVEVLDA